MYDLRIPPQVRSPETLHLRGYYVCCGCREVDGVVADLRRRVIDLQSGTLFKKRKLGRTTSSTGHRVTEQLYRGRTLIARWSLST